MSAKKKNINVKKYNPDVDIVPLHPTGFGIATDKEGSIFILDFTIQNIRNNTNELEVILGSYAITRKMADNLMKTLKEAIDKIDNDKNEEDNDSK